MSTYEEEAYYAEEAMPYEYDDQDQDTPYEMTQTRYLRLIGYGVVLDTRSIIR